MNALPKPLKNGFVLNNRYKVEELLGLQDIGFLYLCRDQLSGNARTRIRIIQTDGLGPGEIVALGNELSLLRRLRHPNLGRILDFGVLDGSGGLFLAQEWFEGKDIWFGTEGMDPGQILGLIVDLARALNYLHSRGIVHGCLSPLNTIFSNSGETKGLKLLDFGLVRCVPRLLPGTRFGNLAYLAPEVLMGAAVDASADLYSLGIMIYQLLTRRLPFEDADPGFLIQKHLQVSVDLRPIGRLRGGTRLTEMLGGLLEKDSCRRSGSCESVIQILTEVLGRSGAGSHVRDFETFFSASRFVGREKELSLLQQCASRVRTNGRGWTVFVVGEGGSGKTRLIEEFTNCALLGGWRVIEGDCGMHEEGPYGPYRQILAKTESMSGQSIFRFSDVPRCSESGAFEPSPEFAAGQFRDLLTRELVRRLSERPTLLLLHDFHLADEATSTVLDYLSSDIRAHPVLMCVSLRPGEDDRGVLKRVMELAARQERGEVLILDSLTEENVKQLIAAIMGDPRLKETLGTWLFKNIGGNPFFLEEMLKHLVEQGLLRYELDRWRFRNQELLKLEVPATIGAVLQRRLIQLSPLARELANWLALFRRPVSRKLLNSVSAGKDAEFTTSLRELRDRQLIQIELKDSDEIVELCHALIAEVIQGDLPKARQRKMHSKIAEVLGLEHGKEGRFQEIAMHSMAGESGAKAVRYALALASQSHAEFAHEKALQCFQYVFSNRGDLTQEELCQAAIEASDTMRASGMPRAAIRLLKSEIHRNKDLQAERKACMFMELALCYQHSGDLQMQEVCCKKGLRLLSRRMPMSPDMTRARLWAELAFGAILESKPRRGLAFLDKALRACADPSQGALAGRIQTLAASLYRVTCRLDAALMATKKAAHILADCEESYLSCSVHSMLGSILACLGRFSLADEKHRMAVQLSEKSRSVILRSQALGNMAECLCRMGRIDDAIIAGNQAAANVSDSNNPAIRYAFDSILAEIQLATGDFSGANRILSNQLKGNGPHTQPLYVLGHALYISANLNFNLGNFELALEKIKELFRLENAEAPFYEMELAEALRARIFFERGLFQKAIRQLQALDKVVTRKRWPYQMCIIKLHAAELLFRRNNLGYAEKLAKNALRLAKGMQAVTLIRQSHFVLGSIYSALFRSSKIENSYQELAIENLQSACALNPSIPSETIWRSHAELSFIFEKLSDVSLSIDHAQKAYDCVCELEKKVPPEMLNSYRSVFERDLLKSELLRVIERNPESKRTSGVGLVHLDDGNDSRILLRASAAVNSILDMNQLLEEILDQLIAAAGLERAFVWLLDESMGKLRFIRGRNDRKETLSAAELIRGNIFDEVFEKGRPIVSANARIDPRLRNDLSLPGNPGRLLCGPLKVSGQILGVLYADHSLQAESLSESVVNLFAAFCNLAAIAIDNAMAHQQLAWEKSELEQYLHQARDEYPEIVGRSTAVEALRDRIGLAAVCPLDILIVGESGTGKELVARAIHRTGRRKTGKFLPVDCGSVSDSLAEAELFGYRKGAFTGASENRQGLLESAQGGIVFLDETSNLPIRLQPKLLRVLQEREVRRIGETIARKIDIQVIAATNREILEEIREGRFREDLYHRLRRMEIRVPPLRDRLGDIPLLLEWYLEITARQGGRTKKFSQEAKELLVNYHYPGNIRELQNIVADSYYSSKGTQIHVDNLPVEVRGVMTECLNVDSGAATRLYVRIADGRGTFEELVKKPFLDRQLGPGVVRGIIERALRESKGNYRIALSNLGIPENQYSLTIRFLKRYKCYLDFRPFRTGRP